MKRSKYLLVVVMVALFLQASLGSVIYAKADTISLSTDVNVTLRAEITEWNFRLYNGVLQKRLWSKTYARWLTDWINC